MVAVVTACTVTKLDEEVPIMFTDTGPLKHLVQYIFIIYIWPYRT